MKRRARDMPGWAEMEREMSAAMCHQSEIDACGDLNPIESSFAMKTLDEIQYGSNMLHQSIGLDSAKRYLLSVSAAVGTLLWKVDQIEKDK